MGKVRAPYINGRLSLWAALLVATASQSDAATVVSTTEVFVARATIISGASGGRAKLNYLSASVLPPAVYGGKVTALGAGTVTDSAAVWSQGEFNGTNGSHYIHFENGVTADIIQTDAAAKRLTYPGTLPASVVVGSKYKIRRHLTLASLFGPNNEAGLLAGQSPADADNILVHIPETQETLVFFYSSFTGFTGWYQADYTPASNLTLYPEQGIMVRRRDTGNVVLHLAGSSKDSAVSVPIYSGYNLLGCLNNTKALRLVDLNLYSGNATNGLAAGASPSEADGLLTMHDDGTTSTYFYSNYPGFEGWYDSAFVAASNVSIAPGTAFFVQRKPQRGMFQWNVPSE